jgi:hypothetical protein
MRTKLILSLAVALTASLALAQEAKKPLSPPAKAEAKIGGKNVSINYNAPSKRNRVIMGELVPYGQVWRTGANGATTLTTEADLMVGNVHVPAGTYTLYTVPGETEWWLVINKQTGQWGTQYDQAQDLGRVKMNVKKTKVVVETFNIGLKPTAGKNGLLTLAWENTEASVPVVVH